MNTPKYNPDGSPLSWQETEDMKSARESQEQSQEQLKSLASMFMSINK